MLFHRPSQFFRISFRFLSSTMPSNFLDRYDPQQVSLFYEPLILVNDKDEILGQATKKDAHLLSNIEQKPSMIHRAFSFFLFDHSSSPSRLILQQRAPEKITYPSLWANTCCSHPLFNEIEMKGLDGVKHAVVRRVQFELGHRVNLKLNFRTKIFYQARNIPDDDIFGESEVDYIIFAHHRSDQPLDLLSEFQINRNEVKTIQSLSYEQCEELVAQNLTTPWFTRIVREGLLKKWWKTAEEKDVEESSAEVIHL